MNAPMMPQGFRNKYADGSPNQPPPMFPPNLAATLPMETQRQILMWLGQRYFWPQIQERVPFEKMWAKLLSMSRITIPNDELFSNENLEASKVKQDADQSSRDVARCSDTVIHDAIERLTDITRFIVFKDSTPVQFAQPEYIEQPMASKEYDPLNQAIKAGNALLQWNSQSATDLQLYSTIAYRHHFTYGCAFIFSDWKFQVKPIARRNANGQIVPVPEITAIGTTFEPISINKIWLNWRLPIYDMDNQPCPFFFEETPRFALHQNLYDPVNNPFGYVNVDMVREDQWLYNEQSFVAARTALGITFSAGANQQITGNQLAQILEPKYSVESKWTSFPMMPLDPTTGEFDFDGSKKIPFSRFIVETFGPNIHSGGQVILRLQQNYFPREKLPLYASIHMPDLDSGAYAPSIGQVLYNHFKEITLCKEQFFTNKDWINDPPAWVQVSSPAIDQNLNAKGAKIKVNGPNDFGWRLPYDATNSTVSLLRMLRDEAQTTSKAVDAVLGKAMGSRTSATEASNVYEAAMSGITSDIDLITAALHGNYAHRVWDYSALWMDQDLLKAITGQLGFEIKPEDMWINLYVQTNIGSQYINKTSKQQNLRYILESSKMETILDRQALWFELLNEMGFDAKKICNDTYMQQVQFATLQASETYLGELVLVDPDQDHQVAIKVKTAFIKDKDSVWNTKFPQMGNELIKQIQIHQQFVQLQQQQQMLQQQMSMAASQNPALRFQNPTPPQQ